MKSQEYIGERVTIHHGYKDSVIGDLSGWKGTVLRVFSLGGTNYVDISVSVETLKQLNPNVKKELIKKSIVFTLVRVPLSQVTEQKYSYDTPLARIPILQQIQHDWFNTVGWKEHDPTKIRSEGYQTEDSSLTRRDMIKTFTYLGAGAILFAFLAHNCNDDDDQSNWEHSGGYYG